MSHYANKADMISNFTQINHYIREELEADDIRKIMDEIKCTINCLTVAMTRRQLHNKTSFFSLREAWDLLYKEHNRF